MERVVAAVIAPSRPGIGVPSGVLHVGAQPRGWRTPVRFAADEDLVGGCRYDPPHASGSPGRADSSGSPAAAPRPGPPVRPRPPS